MAGTIVGTICFALVGCKKFHSFESYYIRFRSGIPIWILWRIFKFCSWHSEPKCIILSRNNKLDSDVFIAQNGVDIREQTALIPINQPFLSKLRSKTEKYHIKVVRINACSSYTVA